MNIFNLASKLLSPQQHYDWGLRALKPVLKGCGNMLKMMKKSASTSKNSINESYIVVQALRLNTLSKLTYGDSIRFVYILSFTAKRRYTTGTGKFKKKSRGKNWRWYFLISNKVMEFIVNIHKNFVKVISYSLI